MSADVYLSKPTNNKACLNFKTTSLLRRSLLHASFYLKQVFPQPLIIFFSWGKSQDTHNESYQGVLPRLGRWRKAWWTESPGRRWSGAGGRTVETQREEKGTAEWFNTPFIRQEEKTRHLSVESVWSINWGEWKRPPTPDCGGIKYKERNNHRLSRRKSCWRSKGDRRAVDCSASLFLPDGSTEQRELRKSDNQSRWDTIGEMIYSFPLYTFEFVERATFLFLASPHPPLLSMATGMSCWMGDASCCGPRWRLKTIKSSSSSLHQELKPKFFVHSCLLFAFFFFCKLEQVKVCWSSI